MAAKKVKANDLYISTFTLNFHFFIQLPPDLQPSHISDRFFLCLPCFFQIILIFLPFFVFSYFAHAPISVMLCPKHLTLHFYFFIFALALALCPEIQGQNRGQGQGQTFWGEKHGRNGGKGKKEGKIIN